SIFATLSTSREQAASVPARPKRRSASARSEARGARMWLFIAPTLHRTAALEQRPASVESAASGARLRYGRPMRVHLVDGTYELFRHFYAVPAHAGADGMDVGALRGVLGSV